MITGVLIDPEARTVTVVQLEPGDLSSYYTALECDHFTAVYLEDGLTVYVDDEGLSKPNSFFLIEGHPTPLAGKGLILGSDNEGNSVSCPLSLEQVTDRVDCGTMLKAGNCLMFMGDRFVREIH